jgi:hypothetical protein
VGRQYLAHPPPRSVMLRVISATLRSRRDLVLENLLLRHQLIVAARPNDRRGSGHGTGLFWVLGHRFCPDWRRHLVLIAPDTVVRWHRRGWTLFWRWRSRVRPGQPRLSAEVQELIACLARENPTSGAAEGRHRTTASSGAVLGRME